MNRLLLVLSLLVSITTTSLSAQERPTRREGPPRAELRERLREAAERMPELRERLQERREELRQRLQGHREQLRGRGPRGGRPEGRGEQRPRGERREGGLRGAGPQRRPLLPPQLRQRILEHLRGMELPRQRGERAGRWDRSERRPAQHQRQRQRHDRTDV